MKQFLPLLFLLVSCTSNPNKTSPKETTETSLARVLRKDMSDLTNTLLPKTATLELNYIVWGCACANWVTTADYKKHKEGQLSEYCIFIEPASDSLIVPDDFDAFQHTIKVTGRFYAHADYPKGTIETEENLKKAKVFRYTQLEVIEKKI